MKIVLSIGEDSWMKQTTASIEARSMLYYLQSAGRFSCRSDYITDRDNYDIYLLACTTGGKGYLSYRNREYELKPGDCFLIYCNEHQIYRTDPDDLWNFVWVHFNGSNSAGYFERIYSTGGPVFRLPERSIIPAGIGDIMSLLDKNDMNLQFIASSIIVQMLTEIVVSGTRSGECGRRDSFIERSLDFIEKNYAQKLTLDDIAREARLSRYHFSRVFKNCTGYSPAEYLTKCRLDKAKHLLRQSEDNISEIAIKTGFVTSANLIRNFRDTEGVTPATFRKYWR